MGRGPNVRASNAMLRALTRGAITGEAQPNIHFRKIWKLCRGWFTEGTPGRRDSSGRPLINVWPGLTQRGRRDAKAYTGTWLRTYLEF